ncbi:hypothetical protein M0812_16608 [Anaeramoeba flamelloides]|uniref:Uncharacterized protein n=1 Tax=Anaeramoeba flamelloides TaxID=1746091 RepID=A0AAV7Z9Z3_9EUKA|nr:hypothetical protein M0812_16608 [Anaeramoeba flamelloides]
MTYFGTHASEICEPRLSFFSKQLEKVDKKIVLIFHIPPAKLCQDLNRPVAVKNKNLEVIPVDPSCYTIDFQRCQFSNEISLDKHIFQHCSPTKYPKKLKRLN